MNNVATEPKLIETGVIIQSKATGTLFKNEEFISILNNLPINLNGLDSVECEKNKKLHPQNAESMIKEVLAHPNYRPMNSDSAYITGTLKEIPNYDEVLEKAIPDDHNFPGLAGGDKRLIFCNSLYENNEIKLFSLDEALSLFNFLLKDHIPSKFKGKLFLIFLQSTSFCYVSLYQSDNSNRYKFEFVPNKYGRPPHLLSFTRNGHFIIT